MGSHRSGPRISATVGANSRSVSPRVGSPATPCHCSTGLGAEGGFAAGVADFEDGFEARFGEWDLTTDPMTGGSSSANVAGRDGAVVVAGQIAPGLAFP